MGVQGDLISTLRSKANLNPNILRTHFSSSLVFGSLLELGYHKEKESIKISSYGVEVGCEGKIERMIEIGANLASFGLGLT